MILVLVEVSLTGEAVETSLEAITFARDLAAAGGGIPIDAVVVGVPGDDVVKALALGARAAMIGRAYLWGLSANGQAGVENVLDILRSGIDSGLLGIGKSAIRDLTPDDLLVPDSFPRVLGVPGRAGTGSGVRDVAPVTV